MLNLIMLLIIINNGNHIESDGPIVPNLLHISRSSISKKAFFARGNGFFGLAKKIGASGFNLNKYKDFRVFGNQINFSFTPAPIGFKNMVALAFEENACYCFAPFANVVVFCQCGSTKFEVRSTKLANLNRKASSTSADRGYPKNQFFPYSTRR